MWNGARTMYGLGLNKDDLTPLFRALNQRATPSTQRKLKKYLQSDCQGCSVDDLSSLSTGAQEILLLESSTLFEPVLAKLGLSFAVYPHDITERFEPGTFAVCGQVVCQLRTDNLPPELTPCDTKAIDRVLTDIFGTERARSVPLDGETDHIVLMGCLGYYTIPNDCLCCS